MVQMQEAFDQLPSSTTDHLLNSLERKRRRWGWLKKAWKKTKQVAKKVVNGTKYVAKKVMDGFKKIGEKILSTKGFPLKCGKHGWRAAFDASFIERFKLEKLFTKTFWHSLA